MGVTYEYNTSSFHSFCSFADSLSFNMGNSNGIDLSCYVAKAAKAKAVNDANCTGLKMNPCKEKTGCIWVQQFGPGQCIKAPTTMPGRQDDQMATIASMLSSLDVEQALRALDGNRWDQD